MPAANPKWIRCGIFIGYLLLWVLLLARWSCLPLLLRRSLALLLRCSLPLRSSLPLLLRCRLALRSGLALLLRLTLLRCSLPLLLRCNLPLLRSCLTLLLRCRLVLLRSCLALLLLRDSPIGFLQRRWSPYVAICRNWLGHDEASWPAMVDTRKLCAVGAGGTLIVHLCAHGSGVLLMHRCQFRGARPHL